MKNTQKPARPSRSPIAPSAERTTAHRRRAVVEAVGPEVDGGRFPIKRTAGEDVVVTADVFVDGHDRVAAVVRYRAAEWPADAWREVPMTALDNDRWTARFTVEALGRYEYTVQAWVDHFASWQAELSKKFGAGQDVASELVEGGAMIQATAGDRAGRRPRARVAAGARRRGRRRRRPVGAGGRGARPGSHGGHADPRPARGGGHLRSDARGRRRADARPRGRVVRDVPAVGRARPGAERDARRGGGAAAGDRRHGLRRGVPAAGAPDRAQLPQGAQQRPGRRARRPGQPVGHRRRGGRAQGRRARPGHAGRLRSLRGHGAAPWDGGGARHRLPGVAGPPVRARAPRVVPPPPGRHDQVRGEPAQEVPGHLPVRLRVVATRRACGRS